MIWWALYWYAIAGMLCQIFLIYSKPDSYKALSVHPGWALFIAFPIVISLWPLLVLAGILGIRSGR